MSLEEAVLAVLELDGYKFHTKEKDFAKGITPKGRTCAMVLKINRERTDILISKRDLERLDTDAEVQLYFYSDPVKNYTFWMNDIVLGNEVQHDLFEGVGYELQETQASLITNNNATT
jgi:hypothetical protein